MILMMITNSYLYGNLSSSSFHIHMYSNSLEYYGLSLLMFRDHKLCFSVCFSSANEGNTACTIYVDMSVCKMAHKGTHCGGCNKA